MRITLAVAETGSMTMAGKRLHLSQSAVSKAIKEIEKRDRHANILSKW
ncbi:LysR family transcriptional regulator [Rhizobium beringeri]